MPARNNGVAEELTLKTNEITHKKSDYLEGTYAVHGIEEIMKPEEVVLVIDSLPPPEIEKFKTTPGRRGGHDGDCRGLGADRTADHPDFPRSPGSRTVLQLLAGWNVLVHVGVALGINLDKAQRARKIGNEFIGG